MRVFLSYHHADKDFVRRLAEQLSRQGLDVWYDAAELYPGDNWALKTGEALEASGAMVVVLSPAAMKSKWVSREVDYAIGNPKFRGRVIPVLVSHLPVKAITPWILTRFNMIEAGNNPEEAGRKIAQALGGQKPSTASLLKRRQSALPRKPKKHQVGK